MPEKKKKSSGEFQKENQLWRLRTNHGKPRAFESAEKLWLDACDYFDWMDKNPLYSYEWRDGALQQIPCRRPYTLMGLCIYLNVNTAYFRNWKIAHNEDDYDAVIGQIEEIIYNQKFEGASAGHFNANIISRDLGLADKQNIDNNINLTGLKIRFE